MILIVSITAKTNKYNPKQIDATHKIITPSKKMPTIPRVIKNIDIK